MNVFRLMLLGLAACIVAVLGWRFYEIRPPAPKVAYQAPQPIQRSLPVPSQLPWPAPAPPAPIRPLVLPQPPAPAPTPAQAAAPPPSAEPQAPAAPLPATPSPPVVAALTPGARNPPESYGTARSFVEQSFGDVPEFIDFYSKLLVDFPRTYGRAVDAYTRLKQDDKPLPSPDAMIWDMFRDLQQSHGLLAARADDARLRAFFDARLAMLDAMATSDVRQCADFLYGLTDAPFEAFTREHRQLVANLAVTQIAAIKDGQTRPAERSTPTPADFDLLAGGLTSRQLTQDEIALLLDGKTLDPPPSEARLCDMGRIYLEVLRSLPPEARQRIYGLAAELLARS